MTPMPSPRSATITMRPTTPSSVFMCPPAPRIPSPTFNVHSPRNHQLSSPFGPTGVLSDEQSGLNTPINSSTDLQDLDDTPPIPRSPQWGAVTEDMLSRHARLGAGTSAPRTGLGLTLNGFPFGFHGFSTIELEPDLDLEYSAQAAGLNASDSSASEDFGFGIMSTENERHAPRASNTQSSQDRTSVNHSQACSHSMPYVDRNGV